MTEAQHPTVTELTWSEPDPAIEVHLGMCARCRHLATSRLEFGTSPKMAHAQVPEAVLEALRDPTPSGRPRNGELWRCEWDGTAALVAIVDSSDLDISALAVDTVRPEAAGALAIEGDETELGCPIAIVDAPPSRSHRSPSTAAWATFPRRTRRCRGRRHHGSCLGPWTASSVWRPTHRKP
jgi:hypothetical protein